MSKKREIIVLVLCFLAEIGMAFQIYKPNYFFSSSFVIAGTSSWMIARSIMLINMVGLGLFALSVWRGNIKGRLHLSYFIMLMYTVIMIVVSIVPSRFRITVNNEKLEMNTLVYLITALVTIIVFALFILREKGAIRLIPKMSSILLIVIVGQFVTNGLFVQGGEIISHPVYFIFGIISAIPYLAVFVFEYFILEPTMRRYR